VSTSDPRSRSITIAGFDIHDGSDCYVIAEVGHNHQGSVEQAKAMLTVAKDCGANAVKLQKRSNRTLYTREFFDQPYDNEFSFGPTYGEHREALELGRDDYVELQRYAREIGITFFATPFDVESADFLAELEMPAYKLASADLVNTPLLRHVAGFGKPMLLSTGGSTLVDVDRAVETIRPINEQLCILQCTAAYPTETEDLNLRVITTLRERYPELVIGLSDHQNGISMALVAYMLGARVIEKHFTLNHAWKGTDHAFSLMPEGLRKLVRDVRRVPVALGDGIKRPLPVEEKPLEKMGKKLVAARDLELGHVLAADDVAIKSPADGGLPPFELERLVGRRLRRPIAFEDFVTFDDVEPAAEPPVRAERGPVEGVRGNREVPPTDGAAAEAQAAARR
jgi:N-acetylneuraminate synthase/sialic acid synthase